MSGLDSSPVELLALDVDGTLVGRDNVVSPEVARAVRSVRLAGVRVLLATGRSHAETRSVWEALALPDPHEPLVCLGGAMVAEAATRRTLYQKSIPRAVAGEFSQALLAEGFSPMAVVDDWRWGVDYLVLEGADFDRAGRGWLARVPNVRWRSAASLVDDAPDPLRIHAVVPPDVAPAVARRMQEQFGHRLYLHAIEAPNYGITIVEAFAAEASKWSAIQYVAGSYRIGAGRIAAVGDDVNDIPMLRAAGRSAAMPAAPEAVRVVAGETIRGSLVDWLDRLAREALG